MKQQYDLYGVGNAIMDIQVQCNDDFLTEHGIDKGVMTLVDAARQQEILDALQGHKLHFCSGGSAANTTVGVAEMGGRCAYACLTGDDDCGAMYLQEMRDLGVTIDTAATSGVTGRCVVLITPDAQRTMLTHLGVSANLQSHHLDGRELARASFVYVEGYLFAGEETRTAALEAITLANASGCRVALTLSDPFLIDICRDTFTELLKSGQIDLLFCNEIEAQAVTGCKDPQACATWLHQYGATVALTLGAQGSLILHQGESIEIAGVAATAVDTTGAGDMYAAGLLIGI
ncbi:MAG: adenosine kinase, partial [Mariprofundales bacterium]|nr:adenosine kinase [Mariprofundales bacterium]